MPTSELLWKRYENEVSLHEGYLSLVVKINIFYYAITGAIISFYFLNKEDQNFIEYSLVFPFIMSLFLTSFFVRSAKATEVSQMEIKSIAEALGFKTYSAVAVVLENLLWIFSLLMGLVCLGLIFIFIIDVCEL